MAPLGGWVAPEGKRRDHDLPAPRRPCCVHPVDRPTPATGARPLWKPRDVARVRAGGRSIRLKRQVQKFRLTCLKVCLPFIKYVRSNPLSRRFQNHPDVHRRAAPSGKRSSAHTKACNSRDCRRRQQLVVVRLFLRLGEAGVSWRGGLGVSLWLPLHRFPSRWGGHTAPWPRGGRNRRRRRTASANSARRRCNPPTCNGQTLIAAVVSGLVGRGRVTSTQPTRAPTQSTSRFSPRPHLSTAPHFASTLASARFHLDTAGATAGLPSWRAPGLTLAVRPASLPSRGGAVLTSSAMRSPTVAHRTLVQTTC